MAPSRQWAHALACVLALATVLLLVPRVSRATDFRLQWGAPPGCPERAQVEAEIGRLLQQSPGGARAPLDVLGVITRVEGGFRLQLELSRDGSTSAREVRGATCEALADTAALVVALAVDPEAMSRSSSPGPAPRPVAPTTPAGPGATRPSVPPANKPQPAARAGAPAPVRARTGQQTQPGRPATDATDATDAPDAPDATDATDASDVRRWRVSAGLVGDLGTMQDLAGAVEIGAGVVVGPARLDAAFAFWFPQSAEAEADSRYGGTLGLEAGALAACALLPPIARAVGPRFEVGLPCLAFELGRMHADGENVSDPGAGADLWAAVRGGAAAAWALEPWLRLRLRLEAALPVVRPKFVLRGVGTVHEPGVAGRATLGADVAF
jgi:hypothetical protein